MKKYLFVFLFFCSTAQAQQLQQQHMEYLGTFRLPTGQHGCPGLPNCFDYGGHALAYNPATNSLFIAGHDHQQKIAEISIPTPSMDPTFNNLPRATVLQAFVEATEGLKDTVDQPPIKIGGLFVHGGQLYITAYSYYDNQPFQVLSHFRRPLTLATTGQVAGPFQVGTKGAGFVSGYMAAIPSALQQALGGAMATGNCCLSIISRTSHGPAVSSINPADLGSVNPVPANRLVDYDSAHTTLGPHNAQSDYFNGSTIIHGFTMPEGSKTALFWGRQGTGPYCYGTGLACGDPAYNFQGVHAYPYVYQVWAYNTDDFAAVKAGTKQPWEVQPYAIWRPTLPFTQSTKVEFGGVAYDPATQRIFVARSHCNNVTGQGCIDVWKVNPPAPPVPDVVIECGPNVTCTFQRSGPNPVAITAPSGVGVQINGEWMQ